MKNYEPNLSRGLDYYKLTMGDLIFEKHPDIEATFTLKNRNHEQPLSKYVSPEALQTRLDAIRERGFTPEEIAYYAGLTAQDGEARFTPEYLDHLADITLPEVAIDIDPETNDLSVDTTGPWVDASLWETVVMSEVNEEYYTKLMESHDLDITDLYAVGDQKLSEKIERLSARPDIKIADFGTRRRFSADWHEHVVKRLVTELPENFIGTSNPWFAYKYDIAPIGTFAHELPMVYSAVEDALGGNPLDGQTKTFIDWDEHYRGDLSIALPDTFGSEFFFTNFTPEQAERWKGIRHDSGDPIKFGERVIAFYEENNIDPTTKTIVFSDGLNLDKIIELADYFKDRIQLTFGWGTSLMNDLGIPANNFVMKATNVRLAIPSKDSVTYVTDEGINDNYIEVGTVKLSDDIGKHTGSIENVERYQAEAARAIGVHAAKQTVTV